MDIKNDIYVFFKYQKQLVNRKYESFKFKDTLLTILLKELKSAAASWCINNIVLVSIALEEILVGLCLSTV